jgi:uncharacterized membrane protein YphA (DoxX/SURF4 family)
MLTIERAVAPSWRPATRVAFRFFAIYFGLYVAMTQMVGGLIVLPIGSLPRIGQVMNPLVAWTGAHVFHVTSNYVQSGSGDKLYDWVQAFCILMIAVAGTIGWSVLDRRRTQYDRAYRWCRVFLRFALGSTLIGYGFAKVFPLQMGAPFLTRLLEPYGNFSLMGVLWSSIGASFPYEEFVGLVEVAGGALLFVPRTQLVGALVAFGAMFEVFMLNMTYDVPVKLFSFHLVVMAAVLIAPDAKAIGEVVFGVRSRSRWSAVAQTVVGLYLIAMAAYGGWQGWRRFPGAPKPPLYGIWNIERMTIDGVERPPLITDPERWRRVVVQNAANIVFWQMNDTTTPYGANVDTAAKTIALQVGGTAAGTLSYTQDATDRLVFDGHVKNHALHMETHRVDHTKFLLISRGFHWVQEFPVNR